MRRRWLSSRALLLHLAVVVVAPGCAIAGWWQATRALAGNELSWAYSVEWPIFAVIAVAAWWHLVHEDPEAYRARRLRRPEDPAAAPAPDVAGSPARPALSRSVVHHAARLAVGVGVELALGLAAVVVVPFGRPQGWLPAQGTVLYLVHAVFGFSLLVGAVALVVRTRSAPRLARTVAWIGLAGVAVAGAGGLLTVDRSLVRFVGMAVMFVGASVAGFGYLTPALLADRPAGATPAAA